MWMAGGGVKGGQALGATDEFGVQAAEMRVDAHDLNATLLRLMGMDHEKLDLFLSGPRPALDGRSRAERVHQAFGGVSRDSPLTKGGKGRRPWGLS